MQWENALREGFVLPEISPTMSLPEAVSATTGAVAEHLSRSETVRSYLAKVPKGAGTHCPDSSLDELVKYVAMQKGQIDKSDPLLTLAFHKKLIMPMFEFEQEQVLAALKLIKDVSKEENHLIALGAKLGRAHNSLWELWFTAVASLYQSIDELKKKRYKALAKNQLSQYEYTVFDFDDKEGCTNRQTWAAAFPDVIVKISAILSSILSLKLDERTRAYFEALRRAYTCMNVEQLESVWADVDWAWINIPPTSRIVPVHGMESGYEHPFCVSPEFRIEVRTDEAQDLIKVRRIGTVEHATAMGLSEELVSLADQKLERIDIGVFTCAVRSGVNLTFRIAGQAVPNRQEVLAEGGKIFIDRSSPRNMAPLYVEYVEKHCTKETSGAIKHLITHENMTIHTIDHEYSHPVGCTPESDEGIGGDVKNLLEEAKATMLGILADEWRESTEENRLRLVALTVARLLRFMQKTTLENVTSAAYVRENFVAVTTLFESGVISLSEYGLSVDLEKARSRVWFEHVNEFGIAVIEAYQAKDKNRIRQLTDRYCRRENEPTASLIKWVNRS